MPTFKDYLLNEIRKPQPTKYIVAYKLFRTLKTKVGIFPLFIGKSKPTPIGKWIPAEFLPTKGFKKRAGWHVGRKPLAPHLMKKDGTMPVDRVWAKVLIPDDVDWQAKLKERNLKELLDEIPIGGYYRFPRPSKQGGEWLISGSIKVLKILTQKEVDNINGK